MTCPACQSSDVYRRATQRAGCWVVCFPCGRQWYSRAKGARQLPTTAERTAQRLRAEAAQESERPRHV